MLVQALGLPLVALFYCPKELQVHDGTLVKHGLQRGFDNGVVSVVLGIIKVVDDFRVRVVFIAGPQGIPLIDRESAAQVIAFDIQSDCHVGHRLPQDFLFGYTHVFHHL